MTSRDQDLFDAKLELIHAILDEREQAIKVAFQNFEKRMDGTNEWRAAFSDLTKTMASLEQMESVKERIDKIERAQLNLTSRSEGAGLIWKIFLAAAGAAVSVVTILSFINQM